MRRHRVNGGTWGPDQVDEDLLKTGGRTLATAVTQWQLSGCYNWPTQECLMWVWLWTLECMAGHSGSPKISGRAFRVFEISGFENRYPKFARNNKNPTFRVPENSGSGLPELPDFNLPSNERAVERGSRESGGGGQQRRRRLENRGAGNLNLIYWYHNDGIISGFLQP